MTTSTSGRTTVTLQAGGMADLPRLEIDAATQEAWNRRYALEVGWRRQMTRRLALLDDLERRGRSGYSWTEAGDDLEVGQPEWDRPAVQVAVGRNGGGRRRAIPGFFGRSSLASYYLL